MTYAITFSVSPREHYLLALGSGQERPIADNRLEDGTSQEPAGRNSQNVNLKPCHSDKTRRAKEESTSVDGYHKRCQ